MMQILKFKKTNPRQQSTNGSVVYVKLDDIKYWNSYKTQYVGSSHKDKLTRDEWFKTELVTTHGNFYINETPEEVHQIIKDSQSSTTKVECS